MNRNDSLIPIEWDTLLFRALSEVCPQIEDTSWESITSHSRKRDLVDARSRIVGAYYALSKCGNICTLAGFLGRDRTTLIHSHQQHDWLISSDAIYRLKYKEVLKAVQERMAILKEQNPILTQNTEQMFASTISGKLGRDAEVITLREKSYFKINVAIDGKGKDTPTTWVQVLFHKSDNSRLGGVLLKGAAIVAQGRLEVKAFTRRDGGAAADITLWADMLEITKYPDTEASVPTNSEEDIL